jgi:DNA-binding CsgD family transcriptional regulator
MDKIDYKVNFPLEILLTIIQFATLWTVFYLLYRPEAKIKRITLVCFMLLWRPLQVIAVFLTTFATPVKIIMQAAAFAVPVFLSDGKKRDRIIAAIYLWDIGILVEVVFAGLFIGITGRLFLLNMNTLYLEMTITQTAMLFWAVFYYLLIRAMPQAALDRVPLRFWLIALLTPFFGAAAFFAAINHMEAQLEAGFNNFLLCGILGLVVFALDLCIFYLYIKLIASCHYRLLAGELAKTPPVYTPENGLSTAFIEKYDLSKRQAEITEALLHGKSNKEIAAALNIEVNTVQVHLQNVYRKTGAPGRYAIMALAGKGYNTV